MGVAQDIKDDLNRGAFQLFADYRATLYAEALHLCLGNASDAEDLTIRTLDRAIRKIGFFDESKGRVVDWMRQMMRNLRKNDLELKAANATVAFDPADMESALGRADNSTVDDILSKSDDEFLRRAVNELPKALREAVVLHYLLDQPIAQVAKVLRVPAGTVKARLHYARKVLQGKLAQEMRRPRTIAAMALLFLSMMTYAAWTAGWLPWTSSEKPASPADEAHVMSVAVRPAPFPEVAPQTNAVSAATNAWTSERVQTEELPAEKSSIDAEEPVGAEPFRIRIR